MDAYKSLIALFDRAPVKKTFNMNLVFNEHGSAIFTMPNNVDFHHAMGDTHGGVIATLLDNAGWFTVAAHYQQWVVTVDLSVHLLEPCKQMDVFSIGYLVRAGKSLAVAKMEVRRKHDDALVAIGSGSFAVTSKSLDG